MTDIIKRLRRIAFTTFENEEEDANAVLAAAGEIERLRERVAELQAKCGYTESIKTLEVERLRQGDK